MLRLEMLFPIIRGAFVFEATTASADGVPASRASWGRLIAMDGSVVGVVGLAICLLVFCYHFGFSLTLLRAMKSSYNEVKYS